MAKGNKDFFKCKKSWSEIKDSLLGCYLPPYFQKVLMTRRPIFYIDCFAGKGKFEDGKPGSPLIALEARDACLNRSRIDYNGNSPIETCFIDLNYAADLQVNTESFNNACGTPKIISGRYEDEITKQLANKSRNNVFLYIDPYGIKALNMDLFAQFKTFGFSSFEMLINFNSFGFFRDACQVMSVNCDNDAAFSDLSELVEYEPTQVSASKQSEELLNQVAGGDYWKAIVKDYNDGKINGYQAEKRLSAEYKQQLKKLYNYVLDMPVRLKPGQRPKYRMIHICDHEDGCYLMAENMQRRKEELFLDIQQCGQLNIFDSFDSGYSSSVEGDLITKEELTTLVKESLEKAPTEIRLTKFLAGFVNENGLLCQFSEIHSILDDLSVEGVIQIIRNPAYRKNSTKPTTFWSEKESEGKTITIRRVRK